MAVTLEFIAAQLERVLAEQREMRETIAEMRDILLRLGHRDPTVEQLKLMQTYENDYGGRR